MSKEGWILTWGEEREISDLEEEWNKWIRDIGNVLINSSTVYMKVDADTTRQQRGDYRYGFRCIQSANLWSCVTAARLGRPFSYKVNRYDIKSILNQ